MSGWDGEVPHLSLPVHTQPAGSLVYEPAGAAFDRDWGVSLLSVIERERPAPT